jgi:hypothetical protein
VYPPGYAPGTFAVGPPKSSNTGAVIVVVVVVVMIVIVAIPAVLYVMVTGLGPADPPAVPPTMVLQGGGSWAASANVSTYSFTVSTLAPASANIDPARLQYIVSDAASTPLYSGLAGNPTSQGGFVINVVYNDALDVGRASAGDRIQITVSPAAPNPLVGGAITVNFEANRIATGRM